MAITVSSNTITGCTKAEGIIPTGGVLYVASNTTPTGYLRCNGAAVSRTTYSSLFSAIGTLYGSGNGSTTFNLPDLRGEFIRGWDDGRGVDSGRSIASFQSAYAGNNTFVGYKDDGDSSTGARGEMTSFSVNGTSLFGTTSTNSTSYSKTVNTNAGDTRPRNRALLAIIKY